MNDSFRPDHQALGGLWEQFIRSPAAKPAVEKLRNEWPLSRSIVLDYGDISRHDLNLAVTVIDEPDYALKRAETVLAKEIPVDTDERMRIRIAGLPDSMQSQIRSLGSENIGRLVLLHGLVQRAAQVRQRLDVAAYKCHRCGHVSLLAQDGSEVKEPVICDQQDGGCNRDRRATNWSIVEPPVPPGRPVSMFTNSQVLELIESPEGSKGSDQLERIKLELDAELVRSVRPGDRVMVTGIFRARPLGKSKTERRAFEHVIEVLSLRSLPRGFDEVILTPDDEIEVIELSRDPDLKRKLVASIAPSIIGYGAIKEAIMLQLFGGVGRDLPDGTGERGMSHILLVGDPSTAKSQILTFVAGIAPRGVYSSGKGSSGVGLTAAAVQRDGEWGIEAGAMVLADQGFCCIDELDKMNETDRQAIHTAMEQQYVHVNKVGMNAHLRARCSVLAAANPEHGRFDTLSSIPDQVKLDPALLSRFDAIYVVTDTPQAEQDRQLAQWVLGGRAATPPAIEVSTLRKYLAYARANIHPELTPEAAALIVEFYATTRGASGGDVMPFTARHLEGLRRFAEASARSRLSKQATVEDATLAIGIVRSWLMGIGTVRGQLDVSIIETGRSLTAHRLDRAIVGYIEELQSTPGQMGAALHDVIERAVAGGATTHEAATAIERAKRAGAAYEPSGGYLRVV